MTTQQTKERIDYIDTAKAIGITLVVLRHSGISVFVFLHMPLFFIISGMFFKDGRTFAGFIKNKINKLLIPWGFFYILGCLAFYIVAVLRPELKENYSGLMDVFVQYTAFNYPIWYLLCLFWVFLLYFVIAKIPSQLIRWLVVIVLSTCGCLLGKQQIFLPCYFDIALTSLLFFHIGYILNTKTKVFSNHRSVQYDVLIVLALVIITTIGYYSFCPKIHLATNLIDPLSYVVATTGALALILASKLIKNWKWLSYIGRHSLIILCWHSFFIRLLEIMFNQFSTNIYIHKWGVFCCAMCLSTVMIPISLKLIPWFVGKANIIK